ncbi:Ecl1 domain protein [Ceratobasidium sp. AG-Ba]|nr:Ecl1 domain protein [Ceratobasidium sp. AG-Ba]
MPDALDLDHSYCARCETYIWPEKRQVEVQVPAKPAPAPKGRKQDEAATVTKIRTVISLDRAPLYCSERCRQSDLESGSANARRIMEHFQPSPTSTCASPVSPSQSRCNSDYFSRIAGGSLPWARRPSTTSTRSTTSMSSIELLEEHRQWSRQLLAESADRLSRSSSRAAISAEETTLPKPKPKPEIKPRDDDDETPVAIPFTHRRWKEQTPRPTAERSVEVDVAALYDSYPMSQRVRSASSFGSGSSVRPGSMTASTASDTASIRTTSSRGSTRRQYAGLSAESTRGLLVPTVMLRQECDSPVYSASDDGEEPDSYFPISRNRTITQRTHTHSRSVSSPKAKKPKSDRSQKTIQDLVREAGGPEYESRPVSRSLIEREHVGPLYEITRTPPGPTKRHVVQEVDVDGKTELRIVEEECWEEPQK